MEVIGMRKMYLLFICITLFNCVSYKSYNNTRPNIYVNVVVENNTSDTFFTGKLSGHSLHYCENEKIYSLITLIDWDTSSITMDCFSSTYIYDVVIPPEEKLLLNIDMFPFPINNEKYTFILDENYGIIEKLENDTYNNDEVKFLIYYTKEPFNIQYYKNYAEHIKNNGYTLIGHIENGIIYFVINE
jgi:hypothetical protein